MKNNSILIYVGLILLGLLFGWLIFSSGSEESEHAGHETEAAAEIMWTCSMHPQIMQPEPGDCPICGMDLIPADTGADGMTANEFKLTENALALANVQTTVVGRAEGLENTVTLSGKITENETKNKVQVSYFAGRIERLNVNFTGETIHKDQLLATIYSPELVAAQQELLTAVSLKESQPSLYKAVQNKLKLWKLSDKQIREIEESGEVKENFPVYATVTGVVTEKLVEQGDYIKQGQPLFKIANLNTVWAVFDVYENEIEQFKEGQEITVTTRAFPNKKFTAKVDFINPVLDTKSRTVKLRTVLHNKDDMLKPGMFVKGSIEVGKGKEKEALTIPASAVMWTGEQSVVYVKPDKGKPIFEMRQVTIGEKIGDRYQVLEGLEDGTEIVANGTFTIDAAAQLQGKKSMMNQLEREVEDNHEDPRQMTMELPKSFQAELNNALPAYYTLRDALVVGNVKEVSVAAQKTSKKLSAYKGVLDKMMQQHFTKVIDMLDAIHHNDNLENQRAHFVILNKNLIALVSNLDHTEKNLYVLNCPMANNDNGADWLSTSTEVFNPYYGDKMLKCGAVVDTINFKQ